MVKKCKPIDTRKHLIIQALRERADVYNLIGECDRSIEDCRTALSFCRCVGDAITSSAIKIDLGHILLISKNDYTGARRMIEDSLKHITRVKHAELYARGLNSLGVLLSDEGDNKKALRYYVEVLGMYGHLHNRRGIGVTYHNIGNIYADKGDVEMALDYLNKAREIFEDINDGQSIGEVYNDIGFIYRNKNDYDTAFLYYEKSLSRLKDIGYKLGIGIVLDNMAMIYLKQGNLEAAMRCNQECLTTSVEIGNLVGTAIACNNMGNIYMRDGDLKNALSAYTKSLSMLRKAGYKYGIGMVHCSIGTIFDLQRQYGKAMRHYQKFLDNASDFEDVKRIGKAYLYIGALLVKTGKLKMAAGRLKEAEKIFRKKRDKINLSATYAWVSELNTTQRNYRIATRYADKALSLAIETGNSEEEIHSLRAKGKCLAELNPRKAVPLLRKSFALAKKMKIRMEAAESLYELAVVYDKIGKKRERRTALAVVEKIYKRAGVPPHKVRGIKEANI